MTNPAPEVKVGQIYASTRSQDIADNWNQRRAVLRLTNKRVYRGYDSVKRESIYEDVPVAVLTCDGNGGRMESMVQLSPRGGLRGQRLVSEPDPRIVQLAEAFRGIKTRPPYGWYDQHDLQGRERDKYLPATDLADEVYATLLWPRRRDGSEPPRIELTLHQDALAAVGARIVELVAVAEGNAAAMAADFLAAFEAPPEADTATPVGADEAAEAFAAFDVMEP